MKLNQWFRVVFIAVAAMTATNAQALVLGFSFTTVSITGTGAGLAVSDTFAGSFESTDLGDPILAPPAGPGLFTGSIDVVTFIDNYSLDIDSPVPFGVVKSGGGVTSGAEATAFSLDVVSGIVTGMDLTYVDGSNSLTVSGLGWVFEVTGEGTASGTLAITQGVPEPATLALLAPLALLGASRRVRQRIRGAA